MAIFYDTHAHLNFPDYAPDLPEVVERANAAGIEKIICIGTDIAGSRRAVEIAGQFPGVYAAPGWHPTHARDAPANVRPELREWLGHPKVVAIGETGLDYHWRGNGPPADFADYKLRQLEIFQQQMELAAEFGLNCVIHQREAMDDVLTAMTPFAGKIRAVFHCFSENVATLQRVLAAGWMVSFTGILTFKNGANVREALAATPAGRFMLETDCPFLSPVPYRGKRCEPAYVKEIAEAAALARGCSLDELSAMTCETARGFFPRLGF